MSTLTLTIYFMMWPVIVAGVLAVISRAFYREWREARREGRMIL